MSRHDIETILIQEGFTKLNKWNLERDGLTIQWVKNNASFRTFRDGICNGLFSQCYMDETEILNIIAKY